LKQLISIGNKHLATHHFRNLSTKFFLDKVEIYLWPILELKRKKTTAEAIVFRVILRQSVFQKI